MNIQELIKKGKYDEWVSYGSYYGQMSNTIGGIFKTRNYKYYDMDGDIINVSSISKEYKDDSNIPVFKQYIVEDPTNVSQATYRIVSTSEELHTSGLATCCGLAIHLGNKKFLAHLDTSMKNKIPVLSDYQSYYETLNIRLTSYDTRMVNVLRTHCVLQNTTENPLKATIYAGNLYNYLSVKKAKKICGMVGITDITIVDVDMFDRVSI
jgi:hypothetical protein